MCFLCALWSYWKLTLMGSSGCPAFLGLSCLLLRRSCLATVSLMTGLASEAERRGIRFHSSGVFFPQNSPLGGATQSLEMVSLHFSVVCCFHITTLPLCVQPLPELSLVSSSKQAHQLFFNGRMEMEATFLTLNALLWLVKGRLSAICFWLTSSVWLGCLLANVSRGEVAGMTANTQLCDTKCYKHTRTYACTHCELEWQQSAHSSWLLPRESGPDSMWPSRQLHSFFHQEKWLAATAATLSAWKVAKSWFAKNW